MATGIEKDKIFRDNLVEKAKEIFEKERTKCAIASVNFLSEKVHDIDKEVEKIIDESVKIINEANLDKYLHEVIERDSQIANSLMVENERKIFGEIDFEEVIKGDIKSYCIKDTCIVCKEKRTLKCLKEHFSMTSPIKRHHDYGPISNGEVFESIYDEESKKIVTDTKLNFYEIDESDAKDLITKHRGGYIRQQILDNYNISIEAWSIIHINTIGAVIGCENQYVSRNRRLVQLKDALKKGQKVEEITTETMVKNVFEIKDNDDIYRLTMIKPNISSILNHVHRVDGRNYSVINKAFIIVRRVKAKSGDNLVDFVEPVFVRIENELNKLEAPPEKPNDACLLTRVFYLSRDDKNEKDIIRGILVKAEEIYQKTLDIAGEISANDKELEKDGKILEVLDRNTALKVIVNPNDYSKMLLKEYKLTTNTLENLLTVNIIKETDQTPIRFKTKEMTEVKHPNRYEKVMKLTENKINEIKTIFDLQGNGFSEECEMPDIRQLSSVIIAQLIADLNDVEDILWLDEENQNLVTKESDTPKVIDIMDHDDYTNIYIVRFLTRYKTIIEKQNKETKKYEKEKELNLICRNIIVKRKHDQEYKSVSNLKFSEKKNEYKETKGVYSLVEDSAQADGFKIKAEHEKKLEEAIAMTLSGTQSKKDIFKHQLVSEIGGLIVEIEQKTDYCRDKKPDPKPVPSGKFKFAHAKRVLCDSQNIKETATHTVLSRLLVTGSNTAIKVTVTEPNVRFIAAYRSNLIAQENNKNFFVNRYCPSTEIRKYFDADNEKIELKPEEGEHKKLCTINMVGRFGIMTKTKVTELKLTDKIEEEQVEERDDAKLVHLVCSGCPEADILFDNADTVTDACNFTLLKEKLSVYDFLSALGYLRLCAKSNLNTKRDESALKRFKHRLQRSIFNPVVQLEINNK